MFSTRFRYSLHQNLCVSMLQEGFHRSFKEFLSLLHRWKTDRLAAGPDSKLWQKPSLEEQPDKLKTLKEHLTRAETAQRAGNLTDRAITLNSNDMGLKNKPFFLYRSLGQYVEVYENYLDLARFFSEPDDIWLRHHFYQLSLEAVCKVEVDSGRREAEAHAHLAQLFLEQGNTNMPQSRFW